MTGVFTIQQEELWLFDEQLRQRKTAKPTSGQRREVGRLAGRMQRLHEVITAILRLADELKKYAIAKVLVKSDAELGIETLLSL